MNYQILEAIATLKSQLWAMRPDVLQTTLSRMEGLLFHATAAKPEAARAVEHFSAAPSSSRGRAGAKRVAILGLRGMLMQRADFLLQIFGGTSTDAFGRSLDQAVADDSVDQILIEVDSPGGSVYGVQELADKVAAAQRKKPVVALVNSCAASAAYWIASQAGAVYVVPGGEVGSIGVYTMHEDISAALKQAGIATTLISAGKFKTEGTSFGALSKEARAFVQSRVDDIYGAFTRAVARGRNVTVDQVRAGMGQGRVFGAGKALSAGMVDGVDTMDGVLRSMSSRNVTQQAQLARLARDTGTARAMTNLRQWLALQECS